VRDVIPALVDDRVLAPDLAAAASLVRGGGVLEVVESEIGALQ
jgi:hypothetical protein